MNRIGIYVKGRGRMVSVGKGDIVKADYGGRLVEGAVDALSTKNGISILVLDNGSWLYADMTFDCVEAVDGTNY